MALVLMFVRRSLTFPIFSFFFVEVHRAFVSIDATVPESIGYVCVCVCVLRGELGAVCIYSFIHPFIVFAQHCDYNAKSFQRRRQQTTKENGMKKQNKIRIESCWSEHLQRNTCWSTLMPSSHSRAEKTCTNSHETMRLHPWTLYPCEMRNAAWNVFLCMRSTVDKAHNTHSIHPIELSVWNSVCDWSSYKAHTHKTRSPFSTGWVNHF